jgi:hypothetical protein
LYAAPGYSMAIASTGHTSTQAPQSPQVSASTTAKPSFMAMASNGHDSTQVSQPVHFSELTTAGMYIVSKSKIVQGITSQFILHGQPDTQFAPDLTP